MSKTILYKPRKQSKELQIHNNAVLINNIKSEIDIFGGNRTNARYRDLHKILATTSIKVQDLKVKTHKQHNRDYCDEVQGQIQHCIQRLESKASFNAKKDFMPLSSDNLQLPDLSPTERTDEENAESAWRLAELEEECDRLERDLKGVMALSDIKQFSYSEKQIRLLYRQLEQIPAKTCTPLGDKKLAIGKKLIKCNNQIKKVKRNLKRKTKDYMHFNGLKGQNDNLVLKVEDKLGQTEASVQAFEGVRSDRRYLELQQDLEWQRINLHRVSSTDSDIKHRSFVLLERVNSVMSDSEQKAEAAESRISLNKSTQNNSELLNQAEMFEVLWNNLEHYTPDHLGNTEAMKILDSISEEIEEMINKLRFCHYSENYLSGKENVEDGDCKTTTSEASELTLLGNHDRKNCVNDRELATDARFLNTATNLHLPTIEVEKPSEIIEHKTQHYSDTQANHNSESHYKKKDIDKVLIENKPVVLHPSVEKSYHNKNKETSIDSYMNKTILQSQISNKVNSPPKHTLSSLTLPDKVINYFKTHPRENVPGTMQETRHGAHDEEVRHRISSEGSIDSEIDRFGRLSTEINYYEIEQSIKELDEKEDINSNFSNFPKLHIEDANELADIPEEHSPSPIFQYSQNSFYSLPISDPLHDLNVVEDKIVNIKAAIAEVDTLSAQDQLYQDMLQALKSYKTEIDKIDAGNVAFVRERKRILSEELHNCEIFLGNKLESPNVHQKELNKIREVLKKLSDVKLEIQNFTGSKNDIVYSSLDECLVKLMVQLNNVRTYDDKELEMEKSAGIQTILKNIRMLSSKANKM